jgi:5,10-methylenetetrahydromethanopterin reductase
VITGIQLHGWTHGPGMVECAELAAEHFDTVWLTDQLQSRSMSALLGAIAARTGAGVGTSVTFPFGRNPLELASTMATLADFVEPPRQVTMGIGTGGGLVSALMQRDRPVERVREFILLCRALWRGEPVSLDDYPLAQSAVGFKPGAKASFPFCEDTNVRVVVAGVGPKVLEMAGEVADGVICASNFPSHSLAAFRSGRFGELSNLRAVEEGRARSERASFTRIYGVNVSVSADTEAAKEAARRQAVLIVSQQPEALLEQVGFEPAEYADARVALKSGEGVAAAAALLPQHIADQLVISGSPADCIDTLQELLVFARDAGFEEAYIGAPVGPDPMEAVRLITAEILPELR